ncbi:MAG: serine/threonine protein kinase [Polyangiaceae bacterium]|nr:serine/threonine protein kinase [Polyangiaceae bacterium]
MRRVPADDDELRALAGASFLSRSGEVYELVEWLGAGGMGAVFRARFMGPSGTGQAVVKVTNPTLVLGNPTEAQTAMRKEAVSLQRLSRRRAGTPHVVGFRGTGEAPIAFGRREVTVPWIALEYVHGGPEGVTLRQRVEHALAATGVAFEVDRAARVIAHMADGLDAVHDEGIIHRDIKPENVLACGAGATELFKIADFGIAKPLGMAETFRSAVGTFGYAPPEQMRRGTIGAGTDVFALGATIYFLLTGQDLLPCASPGEGLLLAERGERRSLAVAGARLHPELGARPELVASLDVALAQATAPALAARPPSAGHLAATLAGLLARVSTRPPALFLTPLDTTTPRFERWMWTRQTPALAGPRVKNVSFSPDGAPVAATTAGVLAWTGLEWEAVEPPPDAAGSAFVLGEGGSWVLASAEGGLCVVGHRGVRETLRGRDPAATVLLASGTVDGVLATVERGARGLQLAAFAARQPVQGLATPDVSAWTALAPWAHAQWIVVGSDAQGRGRAGLYDPGH